MPRPSRSNGRPGTLVVPSHWNTDHRPAAENSMRDTCRIVEIGPPVWNAGLGHSVPSETVIYPVGAQDGRCRVQAQASRGQGTAETAGEDVPVRTYLVAIPATVTGVEVGHVVDVTASDDALLVSTRLTVIGVDVGSLGWQRSLTCTT